MYLFPIFLQLEGRRCLVVGAGKVAEAKIESLLRAGTEVLVVAPRATRRIAAWSCASRVRWHRHKFAPRDLTCVSLVVTATNVARVNAHVFREASSRGIFCNSVDDPSHCNFYYPAVVRRGPLQIAISTSGASPALASRLRRELERQYTSRFGDWVAHLGSMREKIFGKQMSSAQRRRILRRIASPSQFERFLNHGNAPAAGG